MQTPGIWPGWYTLILPEGAGLQESADTLENAGVEGLISALSAEVPYMAIPGLESVRVADIDRVLIPGDPRKDIFLSRVGELFQSGDSSLIYLPADRPITDYAGLLDRLEIFSGYRLPDFQDRGGIKSLSFFLAALSILIFAGRRRRWGYDFLSSLLWMPLVYFSPPETWVYALVIFTLSPVRYLRKSEFRNPIGTAVLAGGFLFSLTAILISTGVFRESFSLSLLLSLVLPILFQELAGTLRPLVSKKEAASVGQKRKERSTDRKKAERMKDGSSIFSRKREHCLFEPVSLTGVIRDRRPNRKPVPESPSGLRKLQPILGASLLLLLVFSLYTGLYNWTSDENGHLRIPVPGNNFGAIDSPSAYHRLGNARNSSSLPDASMLLSSLAYQEGFLYGVDYRLPLPGERLVFRDYKDSGQGLIPVERQLLNYDAEWFRKAQLEWFDTGVGRLLSDAGGTVSVSLISPNTRNLNSKAEKTAVLFLTAAAVLALFISFSNTRNPQKLRGTYMPLNTTRRRAKAA